MLVKEDFISDLKADFATIVATDGDVADKVATAIANRVDEYLRAATISVETTVTGTCVVAGVTGTISGAGSGAGDIS